MANGIGSSWPHASMRGVASGFVMANHGQRAPLARMSRGDRILIYSPAATYPHGAPVRAITFVGEITGAEPVRSEAIAGGFRRAASLHEIEPVPLEKIRSYLPVARLRFGCFELESTQADAIEALAEPITD